MDSSRTQTRSSPLTVSSVDTPMVCAGEYVRTLGLLSFAHVRARTTCVFPKRAFDLPLHLNLRTRSRRFFASFRNTGLSGLRYITLS